MNHEARYLSSSVRSDVEEFLKELINQGLVVEA
ncbi:hypothetical protein SAMN06265361_10936 [Laceyella tengchongensis]|uniref:Uncharacterized protein n=1 Tax=Laceyella tengchongensis TaxID=574699 RepID=A0AA46AGY7_9BACL|nr:hypothetical protein SAMN06265361_10936 [Laceyella tengchongensis]